MAEGARVIAKVSIIVPSRAEQFLAKTVADLCAKATGDIEILVIHDGSWSTDRWPDDPRVVEIHHGAAKGMRPSINAGARIAKGEYLMKLDGHCMVAEGFDQILQADCDRDWVVVPRRYALEPESWTIDHSAGGGRKYPIDAHYLSYPFARLGDTACGLHGTPWNERGAARKAMLIDDEMSSQGSCWFMHRDQWARIGELDSASYGNFIQEFQEIGNKTWLGGGRVVVNKNTWYAHLYKGKKYGRGYSLDGSNHTAGRDFCTDFWMNDRWPAPPRVHPLRWLVERFAPVPGWPADLDRAFSATAVAEDVARQRDAQHAAVAAKSKPPVLMADAPSAPPAEADPRYIGGHRKHGPIEAIGRMKVGFTRGDLARLFAERGFRRGAEIGVADAQYSLRLCQTIPDLELLCVDPWTAYPDNPRGGPQSQHDGNHLLAQQRLAPYNVHFAKATSMTAVYHVAPESLDFVFIDGHHSFDYVMQDLIEWSRRVRPGGIVAGHDYYDFQWAGVIAAVNAYTAAHGITDWWICDEREPSFFWIKPGATEATQPPSAVTFGRDPMVIVESTTKETQMGLKVLSAKYHLKADANEAKDVTAVVQQATTKNRLVIVVNNDALGGDPYPGRGKRLTVQFELDGVAGESSAGEGKTLRIPTDKELRAKK